MRKKIKTIIRKNINKLFENKEYYPTFDFEDIDNMDNAAKNAFIKDYESETGENFKEPTKEELDSIKTALSRGNLDLPSDQDDIKMAEKMLEKQLAGKKTPEEIARLKDVMEKMWGAGGINESKKKVPKPPKEPKIPKSSSEKKKKEYKIKAPKPPKYES